MKLRLKVRAFALVLLSLALAAGSVSAREKSQGELRTRDAFRVCADPDNLPFSDRQERGFENRIARLFADELGLPVRYTWFPQTIGFLRNTLKAHRCDVVMGITAGHELVQNTRSYYRSVYVLVYRAADRRRFSNLDSPLARVARIGVVANTPPAQLVQWKGLIDNVRSYELVVDTRVSQPGRRLIEDLAEGRLDMALVWGPIAGYWAGRARVPLEWVPLEGNRRRQLPMDFRISMGVRYGERDWLKTLNRLIRRKRREIQAILEDYGVPLLDRRGRLINPPPWLAPGKDRSESAPPEPRGYRMEAYHAPVPATLEGAVVLDTEALRKLIVEQRPVLIDVYPGARKPPERDPDALWIPPERETIRGAVWLPNVGVGAPPDDLLAYFRDSLERLTGGDHDRPVVFFCNRDCWLSWNAAKRALREFGYRHVYWYPEGADGWKEAGLSTSRVRAYGTGS